MAQTDTKCPRCGEGSLRKWYELSTEEHEVVRRLPGSAIHPFRERVTTHRWCNNCWHEETANEPRDA